VSGGVVTYAKNGAVFYTSGSQAGFAVRAHAVFFDLNGAVSEVAISGASAAASTPAASAAAATSDVRYAQPRPGGSVPRRRR
jgi:hypothetical protein